MIFPLENSSMVWAITGTLGSGKSLCAVASMVADALSSRHCVVVTNIKLNEKAVSDYCGYDVSPYVKYIDLMAPDFEPTSLPSGTPRGYRGRDRVRVLIVLDECAEFFDQYSSARDLRIQKFLSWLRHSSKRSQDVYLIVQSKEFINKSLRLLCARFVVCTNLSNIRFPILHFRFLPNITSVVFYDKYGNRGGLPAVFLRQARWGRFYDTAQQISSYSGFSAPVVATIPKSYSLGVRHLVFWLLLFYAVFVCVASPADGLPAAGDANTTNIQ